MSTKEKLKDLLGFDDRLIMLVGIPIIAFIVPLLFFKATLSDGLFAYAPKFMTSFMFTISYWLSVRSVFIFTRRKFPTQKDTTTRIIYTIFLIVFAFFAVNFVVGYLHNNMNKIEDPPGVTEYDYHVASFMIIALVSAIYESVFLYARWKQTLIETERLRRENVESQLQGLRDQVNPHFLFNSLNTLTYIIPEDPDRAVRFVQMLSKVYRYILEIRDKKLITLEEELRFLDAYIFLLKERFGDNLHIRRSVPDYLTQYQIVPLSLQILFENAIKHNIISKEKPLSIEVSTVDAVLVIRNDLQLKKQVMPSTKVGLQNIKNRYAFFSDHAVEIHVDEKYFEVRLPLIAVEKMTPVAI